MRLAQIGLALAAVWGVAGCSGDSLSMPEQVPAAPVMDSPGPEMAFSHDDPVVDPFADGKQVSAAESMRSHACAKLRYSTLGNVLASRGVNLASAAADSAADLYRRGNLVLGAADPVSNSREGDKDTTGGITRLLDVLVAAAGELITNLPTRPECTVNGVGARLFNPDSTCNEDGFTCVLGMPVTPQQLGLCNDMVKDFGADVAVGQRLAVAAFMAPTFLCDD